MEDRRSRFSILNPLSSIFGTYLSAILHPLSSILHSQSSVLCSHRNSRNTQPHSIDRIARRDKKGPPIRIAPVEVSRVAWDFKSAKKIPFGVDHMNTGRPCAVDVPLAIHFHPVGIPRFVTASIIEQPSIAQGSIGFH